MKAAALARPAWSLVDIGVNLTSEMYLGNYHHGEGKDAHVPDIDAVVDRAVKVGVTGLLITGGNEAESRAAVALAQQYGSPQIKCMATVGCHPTRCSEFVNCADGPGAYYSRLRAIIAEHSVRVGDGGVVAAIGECGLDYDRLHFCPKDVQIEYFHKQFQLALEFGLPMFFHDRNTEGDFERIVREHRSDFTQGVVHSFTGSKEELASLLDLGLFIGINGCSLKTSENLDVVRCIPLDMLLIETDGPYCEIKNTHASRAILQGVGSASVSQSLLAQFPVVKKEKFVHGSMVRGRNEPCTIVEVLETLFELRKDELPDNLRTIEHFAAMIQRNTSRLFGF